MKKTLLFLGVVALLGGIGLYIKKTIDLAKKLVFKLHSYNFVQLGLDSTTIEGLLEIKNESDLEITLKALNIDVYVNGVYISKVKQRTDAVIVPNGTIQISMTSTFSPSSIFSNIVNIMGKVAIWDDIIFNFKGRVVVIFKGIPIVVPIDVSTTLEQMIEYSKDTTQ